MKPDRERTLPGISPSEHQTIVVSSSELEPTCRKVRALGGVVLGMSVRGATYTLSVSLPDGAALAEAMEQHGQ
jgi:hypothetical protein